MHLLLFLFQRNLLVRALQPAPHLQRLPSYLFKFEPASTSTSAYPAHIVPVPIDHTNLSRPPTPTQPLLTQPQHYRPGGSAFSFFDAGGQDAAPLAPYFPHQVRGPSAGLPLVVLEEHRFYRYSHRGGKCHFS